MDYPAIEDDGLITEMRSRRMIGYAGRHSQGIRRCRARRRDVSGEREGGGRGLRLR
jgi:hypothetical protein